MAAEQPLDLDIVRLDHLGPIGVAHPGLGLGGAHEVGEHDGGEQSCGGQVELLAEGVDGAAKLVLAALGLAQRLLVSERPAERWRGQGGDRGEKAGVGKVVGYLEGLGEFTTYLLGGRL